MSEIERFYSETPSDENLLRSIVLFGANTATYKFALSKSLIELARQDKTSINIA